MTLQFQIIDLNHKTIENDEDEDDDSYKKQFCIEVFGKTKSKKSIYLKILHYEPYLYIYIEHEKYADDLIKYYISKLSKRWQYIFTDYDDYAIEQHKSFTEFQNNKQLKFIKLSFKNFEMMSAFRYMYEKSINESYSRCKHALYQTSNTDPIIHYIYEKRGEPTGWIEIETSKLTKIDDEDNEILTDEKYSVNHNFIKFIDCDDIIDYSIMAFDIECDSFDGTFPLPKRDAVIQIGMSFSSTYNTKDIKKIILCLNKTDKLSDIDVLSFEKEADMLLHFKEILYQENPDIIIGYNIFTFDYMYLRERCIYLGIEDEFNQLTKIKSKHAIFKEPRLESAALGVNNLKYYEIAGRISIDLYKLVQRDYKLPSYKLDNVSAYFIKEVVLSISDKKIETKNTYGLSLDQYITISCYDGIIEDKYNNGEKYKIVELTDKSITIDKCIDKSIITKYKKISWCQAKDDISPNDIFTKFKQNSYERSVIAKYCIQDCVLCNKLFDKIKILTNNLSLARVCHVPLSYLFFRGQGIKALSLVLRKTKEKNFLIKKLYTNTSPTSAFIKTDTNVDNLADIYNLDNKEIEEYYANIMTNSYCKNIDEVITEPDTNSYDGAIVFNAKPKNYYIPVIVLDYESLYPKSMMLRNTSQERIIKDDRYITSKYNSVKVGNTTCKFDLTEQGILPEILQELLSARKKYKALMETESDPFKKSILDGLQLAYKITANSVYGITGTQTSDLYMREIAASTTATGREMLLFAKWFVENPFNNLINLALTDKQSYTDYFNEIFKHYPHNIPIDHEDKHYDLLINYTGNIEIENTKFVKNAINYYDKKFTKIDITMLTIDEQYTLHHKLQRYIINKKGKRADLFDVYNTFFKNNKIDNADDIKNLDEIFLNNLKLSIDDAGFKTKQELISKFYHVCNDLIPDKIKIEVIYGDTDSIFFVNDIKNKNESELIQLAIKIGIWASILINILLPQPMNLQYEKVMYPFIIQGKKRYVGNLYEKDVNKYSTKIMGIELKRRDNAPIVKHILAGLVDFLLNKKDTKGAFQYIQDVLYDIINDKYQISDFVISKTIKGDALTENELAIIKDRALNSALDNFIETDHKDQNQNIVNMYKNRTSMAHVALADRIAARDAGNKPLSNDRIEYAYIVVKSKKKLKQCDFIETPKFIKENNLILDKLHYIKNQIMNPVLKFLDLFCENGMELFDTYMDIEYRKINNIASVDEYMK
jgi:DNA polymerase elongation subunit (family B)